MAKNKNRERKQPQTERSPRTAQQPAETAEEHRTPQVLPGESGQGKGRQKRFGHN